MTQETDTDWWNKKDIVGYFAAKLADPRIKTRLESIDPQERGRQNALDLGCGGGRHTELLCQMGFNTYACDVNQEMLEMTKARASHLLPNREERIMYGAITELPFPDSFFDVIVTTGVLHQAESGREYIQAIKELDRVTKPGALILLNIFTNKVLDPSFIFLSEDKKSVQTVEGTRMTLLSREEFYKYMQSSGFLLEEEFGEDIKQENTGQRAVLRAHFKK